MLKVQLTRDLRKNILRGHPWIYRDAIQVPEAEKACLCEVLDKKRKPLAWAIYCPETPLALRVLSTEKKPPNSQTFEKRMDSAWEKREVVRNNTSNAYRLFNGEGDFLPGMICDVYSHVAVLQFDGDNCYEFWDQEFVAQYLLAKEGIDSVYVKPRRSDSRDALSFGKPIEESLVEIMENGIRFLVNIVEGQKTGFFLDQRDNRQYLKNLSKNKKVLNLFSYTGGFSLYAGLGGANQVTSVDLSSQALELAQKSWQINDLSQGGHQVIATDVFKYLEEQDEKFEIVVVDPPSMGHSEKTKAQATKAYIDLFSKSAKLVSSGDSLMLSSCSSHISSEDFLSIIDESLAQARRTGQILRISGQGADHPFPHFCRELRYLKFVHLILS